MTGFIVLYFGINAAYAFLTHLEVIPRPAPTATPQPCLLNDKEPSPLCIHTTTELPILCGTLASCLESLSLHRAHLVGLKDSQLRQAK